jgi:N-acyl-D-aspartate/D-glutamate deacylase
LPENILKDNNSGIEILETRRKEIMKRLAKIIKTGSITIISANGNPHLTGRTLREFSHHRNLNLIEGFFELMKITRFQAEISSPDADEEEIVKAIQNERTLIATGNSANVSCKSFKKFLEMAKKVNMPLEKAVSKITFFPAQLLGLKNRGVIRTDCFADLIVFKDEEVKEVLINGWRIVKDGKFQQGLLAGKFLKS